MDIVILCMTVHNHTVHVPSISQLFYYTEFMVTDMGLDIINLSMSSVTIVSRGTISGGSVYIDFNKAVNLAHIAQMIAKVQGIKLGCGISYGTIEQGVLKFNKQHT